MAHTHPHACGLLRGTQVLQKMTEGEIMEEERQQLRSAWLELVTAAKAAGIDTQDWLLTRRDDRWVLVENGATKIVFARDVPRAERRMAAVAGEYELAAEVGRQL